MVTYLNWTHLEQKLRQVRTYYGLSSDTLAFEYLVLKLLLPLEETEIAGCITDGPQDRGVDAVYILRDVDLAQIHLFNCKRCKDFSNSSNAFPANELDKLRSFISDLLSKSPSLKKSVNPILKAQVDEIYEVLQQTQPRFFVHLCSNASPLNSQSRKEFHDFLQPYRHFTLEEHTLDTLSTLFVEAKRPSIDAAIHVSGLQVFEKSDGNIRGVVATVEVKELIDLIKDPGRPDYLNEAIFYDNIRVFLGYGNEINDTIYSSAMSETNYQFWYLNNGITVTCDDFSYQPNLTNAKIDLQNVQVVNGRQTCNAIFNAFAEGQKSVSRISVLVRIYATKDRELSQRIAEATNSQTRINSRNLRSNDPIQR